MSVIVIAADTHKSTHSFSLWITRLAESRLSGRSPPTAGMLQTLRWGEGLGEERVWALEDCRHVSSRLEALVVASGEDRHFARQAGAAPIPASSGRTDRRRPNRGGDRQLNAALHRIAVAQGRHPPPAKACLARKQAEGKSRIEALRCLKRHLARTVWQLLRARPDRPISPSNNNANASATAFALP